MKYLAVTILGIGVLAGIWFFGKSIDQPMVEQEVLMEETEQQVEGPTATINGNVLQLEVMRTQEEQNKGLSGREELEENTGMLFPFENPAIPGFWMKDMNFSIDIIWIDENFKVVGVEDNIAPETYPTIFRPSSPTMYVLEVNATWAKDHGVVVGDEVVLDL